MSDWLPNVTWPHFSLTCQISTELSNKWQFLTTVCFTWSNHHTLWCYGTTVAVWLERSPCNAESMGSSLTRDGKHAASRSQSVFHIQDVFVSGRYWYLKSLFYYCFHSYVYYRGRCCISASSKVSVCTDIGRSFNNNNFTFWPTGSSISSSSSQPILNLQSLIINYSQHRSNLGRVLCTVTIIKIIMILLGLS